MFGFLKDKLKGALGKFSKEVEKDSVVEKKEVLVEEPAKKKDKKEVKKPIETPKEALEIPAKKKGLLQRIFGKKQNEDEDIIEIKEELLERAESSDVEITEPTQIQQAASSPTPFKGDQEILEERYEKPRPVSKTEKKDKKEKTKVRSDKTEEIKEEKKATIESGSQLKENVTAKEKKSHYEEAEEERTKEVPVPEEPEHKGFFTKITETFTKVQISEEKFEELFWDLEVVLLENNVAVEVIDKIKRDLKKELLAGKVSRKGVDDLIITTLRNSIVELFDVEKIDLIEKIRNRKSEGNPYIISIIGVNGSGKTTSIAKLTHKFQKEGFSVVLAASDTFRAAAIQQLEEHANNLNVKIVKHEYNSDPAAVAFDAIKYAQAKKIDVVLIDTAGRLHSNTNLMRELEKVIRVCKPDIKIFVGESITGNDCVEQAKEFDKAVGIDAIILAKADVDDKGGAAISVSYILQRPILYLGTGQTYDDLKDFDSNIIVESLGL